MTTLDAIIQQKRTLILETFVSELRVYRLAPPQKTNGDLANRMDEFLTALAHAIRRGHSKDAEALHIAAAHGDQRRSIGYDLMALVGEFGVLRATVVEIARQHDALSVCEMERLSEVLHSATLAALMRFAVGDAPHLAPATALALRAGASR